MPNPLLVDTIRLSAPIDLARTELMAFEAGRADTRVNPASGDVLSEGVMTRAPDGVTRFGYYFARGRNEAIGWLEASLPRLVHGNNVQALQYEEAIRTAVTLTSSVAEVMPWKSESKDMRLSRIDLVMDIREVHDPGRLMRAWARDGAKARFGPNGLQSLKLGTAGSREVTIYDKSAEMGLNLPAGHPRHIRIETRLRGGYLARRGIRSLAEATADRLEAERHRAFHYYALHRGIVEERSLLDALSETDWSDAVKAGVLYLARERAEGREPFARATRRSHAARLASLNVRASGRGRHGFASSRIDYETATQVSSLG
jgi:hypothetical protein